MIAWNRMKDNSSNVPGHLKYTKLFNWAKRDACNIMISFMHADPMQTVLGWF